MMYRNFEVRDQRVLTNLQVLMANMHHYGWLNKLLKQVKVCVWIQYFSNLMSSNSEHYLKVVNIQLSAHLVAFGSMQPLVCFLM